MIPFVDTQKLLHGIHGTDDGARLFYDLWGSKMRRLHIPEAIGECCSASYRGWLLYEVGKGSELFLLNPLTRARVDLPPFTTPATHIWADDGSRPINVDHLFESCLSMITKLTFSSDLTDPNCVIMVFFQQAQAIFSCCVGDSRWTQVLLPPMPDGEPADAAYHNGRFYLIKREEIFIYDPSNRKVRGRYLFGSELCAEYKFFLVGKSGLYMVAVHFSEEGEEEEQQEEVGAERLHNQRVVLYKIQDTKDRIEVKHVTDTSDTTIFYGHNFQYLSASADEWDSLNGASMYIEYRSSPVTQFGNCRDSLKDWDCYNILFARLNDGESQQVANGIGEHIGVFPPPAMWFQASVV